ncbi:MAG TPA: spermidine/putrescine ABC transporter substrate-binding protein [Terriglobales bacterium]|nr:spermidine/putrescine ABC transporter substrate-binding protein [Terriglobales bacterium]
MKKLLASVCALMLLFAGCASNKNDEVVKVYNWGDYVAPGVVEKFEQETGIKVVYDTFETNEDMYLKIKNSTGYTYDVVIPSDYMISKMKAEDMLAEIDFANVPNAAGIDPKFKGLDYDPDNKYTVPYMWGTVCLAYAPELVSDPVDSWSILWNSKYEKQIFMMNSERDSIGVALKLLGYSLNTTNLDELEAAKQKLIEQKPLVLALTGDNIKDLLIGREGAIGVLWSCDIGIIKEQDETIQYALPKEGTNVWFDAAVILKNAENKENGEKFIDFLCRPDIALENADYMASCSPVDEAAAQQDESITNNPITNPTAEDMKNMEIFLPMGDLAATYEKIWSDVSAS